ncbi:NADAR family protein [Actinokineospora sp. PR83]|uniref:NADAR family protein n=1 Tax=Actinokineospora sp. PR83 TaxID=2884908 RepID=UPI0027E08366|nr:NADAR family protein [Actinokineospora sp. PR83]MCG8916598.1 NADAR family protein [Actinokineospora sp. PR83]
MDPGAAAQHPCGGARVFRFPLPDTRWSSRFGDAEVAELVLVAGHPRQAKDLGRRVRGFDQPTWEEHRFAVVVDGGLAKFGQDDDLARFLLGTGDRVLVEASPLDRVWGIGLTEHDPDATAPQRWPGLDLLGFALAEARARLRCHHSQAV